MTVSAAWAGMEVSATYLGGNGTETLAYTLDLFEHYEKQKVWVSPTGKVFVAFDTDSEDLAPGGGIDIVVARFDGNLTTLEALAVISGNGEDYVFDLTGNGNGTLYLAGATSSRTFPSLRAPLTTARSRRGTTRPSC